MHYWPVRKLWLRSKQRSVNKHKCAVFLQPLSLGERKIVPRVLVSQPDRWPTPSDCGWVLVEHSDVELWLATQPILPAVEELDAALHVVENGIVCHLNIAQHVFPVEDSALKYMGA